MVNSGAIRKAFIDQFYVQFYSLDLVLLAQPYTIIIIDNKITLFNAITYIIRVPFVIGNHIEDLEMFVTKLGYYFIILGIL